MITIQDNNYQGKVCSLHDTTDLLSIGNKPIRQLCYENEHLLVFPLSIDDTDDRIGDSTIVDIYAEDESCVRIKSGNIMGFVGRKNQQMKIYSRFDNQKHDFFLHYRSFHSTFSAWILHHQKIMFSNFLSTCSRLC